MWANGLKWMFLIVGTLIGAGYASGRELWQFFGAESNVAILLFTGLFTVSCYVILNLAYKQKSTQYVPLLTTLVGRSLHAFMIGLFCLISFQLQRLCLLEQGQHLKCITFHSG